MVTDKESEWHYPRPELAGQFLDQMQPGPAEALTLFAKRRSGKTAFLKYDMTPVGIERGLQPVFVDLWEHRSDPGRALADAFQGAAEFMESSEYKVGKTLGRFDAPVTGIKAFGFGIDMKAVDPKTGPTDNTISRFNHWATRMVRASKHPVLLMVDEVQALAEAKDGVEVASALRAFLQKTGSAVQPVFTGSSRDGLARLFNDSKAAFYEYGASPAYPMIDDKIADFMASRLKTNSKLAVDAGELREAFHGLGSQPGPFKRMVIAMSSDRSTDVAAYMQRQIGEEHARAQARADNLSDLQRNVLVRVHKGEQIFSTDAMKDLEELTGKKVQLRSVQNAVEALRDKHIIGRAGYGDYYVEDADVAKIAAFDQARATEIASPSKMAAAAWLENPKEAAKRWPQHAVAMKQANGALDQAVATLRKGGASEDMIKLTSKALQEKLADSIAHEKPIGVSRKQRGPER